MGLERYQAEPPRDEAAAPLGRLLKAMEEAINLLIEAGPDSIGEIKRETLPEEGGDKAAAAQPPKPGQPAQQKDADDGLVKKSWVEFPFVGAEPRFRRFINDLIASKKQFYIPKDVVVANEKLTGPPKVAANAAIPVAPGSTEPKGVNFVVGNEKLNVTVRFDIVDFAEPKTK